MTRTGTLETVGPGRYRLARSTRTTEHRDLAVAAAAVPRSVACLTSALRLQHIGVQLAAEGGLPFRPARACRVINISPAVFDLGIEEQRVEGQTVRIYSLARTVAECFRSRNM